MTNDQFELKSRRYIGNKAKLTDWILSLIKSETKTKGTFIDIFSGTSMVANAAMKTYQKVILNDILHSNNIIYNAFYPTTPWDKEKVNKIVETYNALKGNSIEQNYFSKNFGGKFYDENISKIIGFIREDLELKKQSGELNTREYSIILTSLIYTMDRLANTVGHFDAYIKKDMVTKPLNFRLIKTLDFAGADIHQEDANQLARKIQGDVAYIDPPYNSRQYSRFYHVYENLVQWKKPKLYGVALKPEPENMSKYCTVKAKATFKDLVENLDVKYLAVSYNNTYKSKSKSSENKIKFEEIVETLEHLGETKIFEQTHAFFNTGKTEFNDHKEFLFLTKKNDH